MTRKSRGSTPYAPKVEHLEVREDHVKLRTILFIAAIVLAVVAFGVGINSLLTPDAGWKEVECTGVSSGEVTLHYLFGSGETGAAAERRQVTAVYSQALTQAETQLSAAPADAATLDSLSSRPNEAVSVDAVLYKALESYLETGSRAIYFGPLYSRFYALFASENDEDAALYDPARSREAAELAKRLTEFAGDDAEIHLEMLDENRVRLFVSEAYLAFARENELGSLLDFGFVKNAFVIDAVAEALLEAGFSKAVLTSSDGYSRSLCGESFTVNLLERTENGARQAASAAYEGPKSVAALRAFPAGAEDALRFYTYADGTICPPVLDETTGMLTAANDNLVLFGAGSAGPLALTAMRAMTDWNLEGLRCLYSRGNTVYCTDPDVQISQLFEGVTLEQ